MEIDEVARHMNRRYLDAAITHGMRSNGIAARHEAAFARLLPLAHDIFAALQRLKSRNAAGDGALLARRQSIPVLEINQQRGQPLVMSEFVFDRWIPGHDPI